MPPDFLQQISMAGPPDKTALIVNDKPMTYRELDSLADLYARTLTGLEVKPGNRVSMFMGNRHELAALYLACFRIGAVAVPTSCYSKPLEVAYEMNHCQASLLLAEPELYHDVKDMTNQAPTLKAVYMVGGDGEEAASWNQAVSAAPAKFSAHETSEQDPAVILYTSGSTGRPKGVTHTVYSLFHSTLNRCAALGHTADDRYFITSYLCHGSALTSVFLPMLYVGGTAILPRHWSAPGFLQCLRRERPTVAACSPSQLQEVLNQTDCTRDDFTSVRYLHVGGDAVPRPLFDSFYERTGLELSVALGMTECGGYLLSPLAGPARRGSLGKPIPGSEIRLVDEEGRDVTGGEPGQIIVRTKALMGGYWNDPENTAAAIEDGWLFTGDLATKDDDGFYYFVGRSKHIIIRGGGNIAPAEVESALLAHPEVKLCGVAGFPDGQHGEGVMAFIVPESEDEPPDLEDLVTFANARLADRKVPQRWVFVDEIPLTPMAKVDRKALKIMAREIIDRE